MIKIIITKNILYFICIIFILFSIDQNILDAYPAGWSDDILLTPEDSDSRSYPDVDVDGLNKVWVVWDSADIMNGTAEILYTKRDSLGGCIIPESTVSNNPTYSILPRLVVDGSNNVHFIWRDASPPGLGLWYAKLANDGSVIVPSHLVEDGVCPLNAAPEVALNRNKELNIIWDEEPGSYNYMNYTKLDSMGNILIPKMQVSPININSYYAGLAVDSLGNVHMGYRTNYTSIESLTYTKVDKNGNILISNKILDSGVAPSIVADPFLNIHMVYCHRSDSGWDINYLKLDTAGQIIITPKSLSIDLNNMIPHMAIDSLHYLHIVWYMVVPMGIMYTKMDLSGSFIIPPMLVVNPPQAYWPGNPRIAVDRSNRLHLVWEDQRFGANDIFYKRGDNDQSIGESGINQPISSNLSCSPNPFTSFARIPGYEKEDFNIMDITGRVVGKYKGARVGENLPAGVYFIISQNKKISPGRIVKIK